MARVCGADRTAVRRSPEDLTTGPDVRLLSRPRVSGRTSNGCCELSYQSCRVAHHGFPVPEHHGVELVTGELLDRQVGGCHVGRELGVGSDHTAVGASETFEVNAVAMSDVMGLRTGASYIGELAYAGVITSLKDHYQQWSTLWLHDNESANAFAAFLSRPSAGMILADGIIWLSAAVAEYSKYDWREDGLTSNLALALQRAWKDNRSDVVKDGPFRDAFFALLSLLVQKQDEVAVVLQREVVEAISS